MKIAYIELDTHAEIALRMLDFANFQSELKIDFYFSSQIINKLNIKSDAIIYTSSELIFEQLKYKKYDLVIIGTVHRYFGLFYSITRKYKTAIIIHNLNFFRLSTFSIFFNIFREDFLYRIKLLFKESLLIAPLIWKKAHTLFVLDKSMSYENCKYLPLFYCERFVQNNRNNVLTIVIPGRVSQKRRDYNRVLNLIKDFLFPTKIIFLGRAKGKELNRLQIFEKNKPKHIEIEYFNQEIPQWKFDKKIESADLLWCPIQTETTFFSTTEIYGKTKMSGNIGDAIRYGKIAVFPKDFQSDYPFIVKEKDNLEKQFQEIKNLKIDFNDFKKERVMNQLIYTLKSTYRTK